MLLRARACGNVPVWQPVSTTPTPSSLRQVFSFCRTVAGLPTMANTPFSMSSQVCCAGRKKLRFLRMARAERGYV